jgi:hypothetical protein
MEISFVNCWRLWTVGEYVLNVFRISINTDTDPHFALTIMNFGFIINRK